MIKKVASQLATFKLYFFLCLAYKKLYILQIIRIIAPK